MLLQLDDDGFGHCKLLIIGDWRIFWMGHKGDVEHKYTLNKGRLPEDLIEKMREAFASASERYPVTATKRHETIYGCAAELTAPETLCFNYGSL
jgi:hypothetical protein